MTKRLNPDQKPYLSFCLIARNCAKTVRTTLESIRARSPEAEIVIVDTMSSDNGQTEAICKEFADVWVEWTGPNGTWTREMQWFDDAAAARQKSFDLASGSWLCWIDTDDELTGPEETKRLLEINARWKPGPVQLAKEVPASDGSNLPPTLIDLLKFTDKEFPQIEGFWCPYLYRQDTEGRAITWQERERIVRNNGHWHWRRKAHEILVPVDAQYHAKLSHMSHLLFVHRKEFNDDDIRYSLQRHFDVLITEYEKGSRNCQDLLYLENYSIFTCPHRRQEFIGAAYDCAHTTMDRMRVLIRAGIYAAENGFYMDSVEHFSAAQAMQPELPDAWFNGAVMMHKNDHFAKAAEWYEKGIATTAGHVNSEISPRDHHIKFRVAAAVCYLRLGQDALQAANLPLAKSFLESAHRLAQEAANHPSAGPDKMEAMNYSHLMENELEAARAAENLRSVWQFLIWNDETQKAAELLKIIPHNLLDHPITQAMEHWSKKVTTHMTDKAAYRQFYDEQENWGAVVSIETCLNYDSSEMRIKFLIDQVKKNLKPDATLMDIGAFDGIAVIPLMKECKELNIIAVETQESALNRLKERVARMKLGEKRIRYVHALDSDEIAKELTGTLDAVVFFEVIEHVPNPVETIKGLLRWLRPGGKLFLSTPWGAYDRGHSYNQAVRDPRGHLRAMMPRELIDAVEEAGGHVQELGGSNVVANFGDTLFCMVEKNFKKVAQKMAQRPTVFAVPSALWDWNATHVYKTGIGASEETIVYLARELAAGKKVQVYGPLPRTEGLIHSEIRDSVQYFPREQSRLIPKDSTVVVSRGPSYGKLLDQAADRELDKILWLQDAWYPDLNAEVAKTYQKIVVLSQWHKKVMHEQHGVPRDSMVSIPNFILENHFKNEIEREQHRFIYASSPDRGLIDLLKMWPSILEKWPDAKLGIFYGWDGCMKLGSQDAAWNARYRKLREDFNRLRYQPGIEDHGRVNHEQIAQEFQRSSVWAYPTDFCETFCTNAVKARAAGCIPVTTPLAALNESAESHLTQYVPREGAGYVTRFIDAIEKVIHTDESERFLMSDVAISDYALGNQCNLILETWKGLVK